MSCPCTRYIKTGQYPMYQVLQCRTMSHVLCTSKQGQYPMYQVHQNLAISRVPGTSKQDNILCTRYIKTGQYPCISCIKTWLYPVHHVHHHHHLSLNHEGRWGTTDDFARYIKIGQYPVYLVHQKRTISHVLGTSKQMALHFKWLTRVLHGLLH